MCCAFLFTSSYSLAQQGDAKSDKKPLFEPAITEADIASYYPNKYPNVRWENLQPDNDFYQSSFQISLFSPKSGEDGARLWSQTKSVFVYGFGVIGAIALLPEDISKWDKEQGIFNKWTDNVKNGPVWDRDDFNLNYIGHPYFGGLYYQAARKSGYRQWDSFIYAAVMSSFYWEFGIEAFAEVPSIQDLVVTPVLGWTFGEWAFTTEMDIRANNDTLFGSSFLGATALILLDPVDSAGVGLNNLFGKEIIKAGTGYVSVRDVPINADGQTENQIQFNISLQLGDGGNYNPSKKYKRVKVKDPIDTGIVGLSYGGGKVFLDDDWQVENGSTEEYSLGLYFSKKFSARVSYSSSDLNPSSGGEEVSYENYGVDGQYYFNSQNNFRPYITTGFGETMWSEDYEDKIFQVNLGSGIHYKITNNLSIQLDWRRFYSTNTKTSDDIVSSRIIYFFGKGER
ncbi:MAG: ubiquitin-protein ligase [Gammaproteobacteria bacterium]|nr:MAG: ubiquitin-protein ligase [Gammaproteobacteria bacterium]